VAFKLRSPELVNSEQQSFSRACMHAESRRTSRASLKSFCKKSQEERDH